MNSAASGLKVRFFNVTIPTGRGGMGNSMGRALSPRRLPLNLKNDPGRNVRKRPVRNQRGLQLIAIAGHGEVRDRQTACPKGVHDEGAHIVI